MKKKFYIISILSVCLLLTSNVGAISLANYIPKTLPKFNEKQVKVAICASKALGAGISSILACKLMKNFNDLRYVELNDHNREGVMFFKNVALSQAGLYVFAAFKLGQQAYQDYINLNISNSK